MAELPDTMKLSPWAQLSETPLFSARVKETNLEQNCDTQTSSDQQLKLHPVSAKGYAEAPGSN